MFRVDNGPQCINTTLRNWAETHKIAIQHIQLGSPQQNAYDALNNHTAQHKWLGQYIYESIEQAQATT